MPFFPKWRVQLEEKIKEGPNYEKYTQIYYLSLNIT